MENRRYCQPKLRHDDSHLQVFDVNTSFKEMSLISKQDGFVGNVIKWAKSGLRDRLDVYRMWQSNVHLQCFFIFKIFKMLEATPIEIEMRRSIPISCHAFISELVA